MRRLNSATLFAAAAAAAFEIYREQLLKSVPISDSPHRSLSAAAGFGMRRLNSATHFADAADAADAEIYRKRLLRSVPICDSSHCSLSTGNGFGMRKKRLPLPAELSASGNVAELTCESAAPGSLCHVYLIGVVHDASKSSEEVKALIEFVKPQVVFVELCPSRAYLLKNASSGGEFYVANEEATKYGAKIILGDRPYDHFFEKDELGALLLILEEMARLSPSFHETIFNERDQYMSAKLLEVARKHHSVVVVVGRAHLQGIHKHWKQPIDIKPLLHTPTRTRTVKSIRRILLEYVVGL